MANNFSRPATMLMLVPRSFPCSMYMHTSCTLAGTCCYAPYYHTGIRASCVNDPTAHVSMRQKCEGCTLPSITHEWIHPPPVFYTLYEYESKTVIAHCIYEHTVLLSRTANTQESSIFHSTAQIDFCCLLESKFDNFVISIQRHGAFTTRAAEHGTQTW